VTVDDLLDLCRSFERSAFRLETLDRYSVSEEDEDYQRWSRGEAPPPIDGHPWFDGVIRAGTSAGKRWERTHVLRLPLTDYLRFELEYEYTCLQQAGDDCHILEVPDGNPLPVPAVDFWLFDDTLAVRMDYDPEGHLLACEQITDAATVGEFLRTRDTALSMAIPFPTWLTEAEEAGRL
jgi:hypothetical protein